MTFGQILLLIIVGIVVLLAATNVKKALAFFGWTKRFSGEVEDELRKVAWPAKESIVQSTVVVGFATIFLVLIIGVTDSLLGQVVNRIFTGEWK